MKRKKKKCKVWESHLVLKKFRKFCAFKDEQERSLQILERIEHYKKGEFMQPAI